MVILHDVLKIACIVLYCIVLSCIVLYCIMRPYTDGPIGPLSYRHSSGVVRNPHSPWLSEGSLTCDPYHHRASVFSQKVVTRFFSQMELYSRHGLEMSHASNPNFFSSKFPLLKEPELAIIFLCDIYVIWFSHRS